MNQTAPRPRPAGASHTTTLPRRIPGRVQPAHVLAGDRRAAHPGRIRALLCRRLSPAEPAPGAIAVLAPAEISGHLVSELNAIHGQPLYATAVADKTIGGHSCGTGPPAGC